MTSNPGSFLSRCKKKFPERSKSPRTSDETPRSFASKFLRNRNESSGRSGSSSSNSASSTSTSSTSTSSNSASSTSTSSNSTSSNSTSSRPTSSGPAPPGSPVAKFLWKRIGLTTNKPIPIESIENALATIRSLKASLNNLINLLTPLINDADIALRTTPRPTCSENCKDRCTRGSKCYWEAIETFDKVVNAGGPMCFVEAGQLNHKHFPTSYSHLNAPSKTNTCPSSPDHDHLHVTNNHRILLENMQSQLTQLCAVCSQLNSFHWTYRNMPVRFNGKKQRSQDFAVVEILNYWNNMERVRCDYAWIWGGEVCRNIDSWEDFKTACRDIAETKNAGIAEFNLKILIKNDLLLKSECMDEKKKRGKKKKKKKKKVHVSALYPDNRRPLPMSPEPNLETEDWEERCEECDRSIEQTRNARELEAGGTPGSSKSSEASEASEASDNSKSDLTTDNESPEEQFSHGKSQGLEQAFARIFKLTPKSENLTDEVTGRFTTKAKGKWRCERDISPEEELELYNRDITPASRELCSWCRDRERSAEPMRNVS